MKERMRNARGFTQHFPKSAGFTMIELAIVLVIIGIILGAVLKGGDLIEGARAKRLTANCNAWSALAWAYADMKGRFPGDFNRDGIIGNQLTPPSEQTSDRSAIGEMAATGAMASVPENPITLGGGSYWVYFGYDTTVADGVGRNVMVICKNQDCNVVISPDEKRMLERVDTAIDGRADAGLGQFRAFSASTLAGSGIINNRRTAVVTNVIAVNESTAGASIGWGAGGTQHGAVWLFDRPY